MASADEVVDDCSKEIKPTVTDAYSQLEVRLKKRNKILRRDEIYSYAQHDDVDLTDLLQTIPLVKPNKQLQTNENLLKSMRQNIIELKRSSELEMDFTVADSGQNDELDQVISNIRKVSNDIFKRLKNIQINFNELLNSKADMMETISKNDYIKMHEELIKQTCEFDKGIESVFRCDKDVLEKHLDKDLEITNINEFKNAYNELEHGIIGTVYDDGVKSSKNHEHLLAIKQYNKCNAGLGFEIAEQIERIDPYTRKIITKPVTNEICKHIYDQESVKLMFQNKHFISCPYIGCGNKHITKKDLVYDQIGQ